MLPPPAADTTIDKMNYVIFVEVAAVILPHMNTGF
jgi:hypothetical protein